MKLLEHIKTAIEYKIRIWLDESKFDLQGNPYPEWVFEQTWGLEPPLNIVEDGKDAGGKPKTKKVPAMTQQEYEKSQLEESTRQAEALFAKIMGGSNETVTAPKDL